MQQPTLETLRLSQISPLPGYETTELHDADVAVLANLSSEALDALSLLRPIVVEKSNRKDAYRLLAGGTTFRAIRAANGESATVHVVVSPKELSTRLITAMDKLVIPAAEGAGSTEQVIRRWMAYIDESDAVLSDVGLERASQHALADHLGITRNRVSRAIKALDGADKDDQG